MSNNTTTTPEGPTECEVNEVVSILNRYGLGVLADRVSRLEFQRDTQAVELAKAKAQLAAYQREHEAWEAMRNGKVAQVFKGAVTGRWKACCTMPYESGGLGFAAETDPVDAVLAAAKAQKKEKR